MFLNPDGMKPIYIQVAEWLENEILSENIMDHEKIYSQYQLAEIFNINPATAAKGLNILADETTLYKKRGLGMFVSPKAKQRIIDKRKNQLLKNLIVNLVIESNRLDVNETELIEMIKSVKKQVREES